MDTFTLSPEPENAAKQKAGGGRMRRLVVPFSAAPWYHDREEFADWGWVRDSNGHLVAKCVLPLGTDENQHRRDGTDPTEGNARLIAAAPELFSVLDALIREMDDYGRRTAKARALLARIRGHNARGDTRRDQAGNQESSSSPSYPPHCSASSELP